MGILIQIIILMAVLASMVMVLLAIRKLSRFDNFDDEEETLLLKQEVEEDSRVVSDHSIFHNLIEEQKEKIKEKSYKKTSKEPFSRKE